MDSIWENIYSKKPAISWLYKGDFTNLLKLDFKDTETEEIINTSSILEPLGNAIVSINVGKREAEVVSTNYAGIEYKIPAREHNNGTLNVTFNEDNSYSITKILEYLYKTQVLSINNYFETILNKPIMEGDDFSYKLINNSYNEKTNRIEIACYKQKGFDIIATTIYMFYGCKLDSISDINLSYNDKKDITRDCTFIYDFMRIIDVN